MKVNATKSFFARAELEYLGFWITREGIQPLPKKVEAIQRLAAPTTKKQLRGFIGLVNYYRDMWARRSHVLATLASLTSKTVKWHWGPEQQDAFEQAKKIIAKENLLAHPDFDKPFVIHTDASHLQLGGVISQDGKPIAFYSRKLKPEQTRCATTERELLSIVETLKEFRNILLGHKITVCTDHQNLTYKKFNTERAMRWRLILEECGPELKHHVKGAHSVVADALSRLEMLSVEEHHRDYGSKQNYELFAGETGPERFPLTCANIAAMQEKDKKLQKQWTRLTSLQKKDSAPGT